MMTANDRKTAAFLSRQLLSGPLNDAQTAALDRLCRLAAGSPTAASFSSSAPVPSSAPVSSSCGTGAESLSSSASSAATICPDAATSSTADNMAIRFCPTHQSGSDSGKKRGASGGQGSDEEDGSTARLPPAKRSHSCQEAESPVISPPPEVRRTVGSTNYVIRVCA